MGLYEEAETKIKLGIRLARENANGYYLAKGYRHLFGIAYRNGRLEKAEEYLNEAIKFTDMLNQDIRKDELVAEIHFAMSSLEYKKDNLATALVEIEIASKKYGAIPGKEWPIKILARKGDILLRQSNVEEALPVYTHGLHESRQFHLNKQIVANLIGIGKCQCKKGELRKAKQTLEEAFAIANNIGMVYEKQLINIEMEVVNSQIKSS